MKNILEAIAIYRQERGWTEYQLAERSGLPQSTISSWYRKSMVPTVPSLEKVCTAFTPSQRALLDKWDRLDEEQQAAIFQLIDKMS